MREEALEKSTITPQHWKKGGKARARKDTTTQPKAHAKKHANNTWIGLDDRYPKWSLCANHTSIRRRARNHWQRMARSIPFFWTRAL